MRLINADVLEDQLRKIRTSLEIWACDEELSNRGDKVSRQRAQMDYLLMAEGVSQSIEKVRLQPTVEKRKTGKWELDEEKSKETIEKIYICSTCRNNEAWGETERTRYCSYCGAEMENWT